LGFDLIVAGSGKDFINGGQDDAEIFGDLDDDFILCPIGPCLAIGKYYT
jgi:hypothetical protein